MAKTVTYYYPDEKNPSGLKVFQDCGAQVRGFYFKRDYVDRVVKEEHATNYAICFLFNENVGKSGIKNVYLYQSRQGVIDIIDSLACKDFWTYGMVFISDNNAFDSNALDYIEYHFAEIISLSRDFLLCSTSRDQKKYRLSVFDKAKYETYIGQIEFLLSIEGVNFGDNIKHNVKAPVKYYHPVSDKYNARVYFDEEVFVLCVGSLIYSPREELRRWSDGGKLYKKLNDMACKYRGEGKLELVQEGVYRLLVELPFDSVSAAAQFISGSSQNGWIFFDGISELRSHKD